MAMPRSSRFLLITTALVLYACALLSIRSCGNVNLGVGLLCLAASLGLVLHMIRVNYDPCRFPRR